MRSAEEIIDKLKGSFNAPRTKDEKIKVVVFCIIISTTFWFFSALNKSDYITQINYPIEFQYNAEAFVATGPLPEEIRLEVSGGGWDLMTRSFGFGMQPIRIRLDDPSQSNYKLSSTLRGELTPLLEPVIVNFILTDSIKYSIERRISRSISLAFDTARLQLATDYRLVSDITIEPAFITFTGPESMINALPEPYLIPVAEEAIDESIAENFDIPEPESDLITTELSESLVSLEVDEFVPHQRAIQVLKINFNDSTLALMPGMIDVSYTIKRSEEVRADSLDIMLMADYQTLDEQDSTVKVSIAVKAEHIRDLKLLQDKVKIIKKDD